MYVCQCMPTGLYQRPAVCMSAYACTHVKDPLLPFVRVGVNPTTVFPSSANKKKIEKSKPCPNELQLFLPKQPPNFPNYA